MKTKLSVLLILIISMFIIITNYNNLKEYNKSLFYMDTYIDIKIYTNTKKKADIAFKEIENIYKYYHEMTNIYDINSELYKLNNSDEEIVEISDELYNMISLSLKYKVLSNNKFDINIANLTKLWKYYRENNMMPNYDELKNSYIKSEIILLDNNKIKNDNLNIDLGAVSKGYATSKASDYLKEKGIKNYIINAGGNVIVGENYNKDYFSIGIESPIKSNDIYKIVKGNNISVVTSGGYERFYELSGIKYHHIIDPDTLYPANNMLSVTVITDDSKIADIMSTILFLLPINDALNIVESLENVEAIFYVDENNIITSKGFKKYE